MVSINATSVVRGIDVVALLVSFEMAVAVVNDDKRKAVVIGVSWKSSINKPEQR